MHHKSITLEQPDRDELSLRKQKLFLLAIILIGFNLRPAITSVGPILEMIRDQIGLANWSAGMITSFPLIAFALMSPLAPKIGRRLGNMQAILLGIILLLIGIGIRSSSFVSLLFLGTAVVGIGISIMNVLLPAVIKEKFPDKVGRMTSVYSTAMVVFAATGSGVSVPLAKNMGFGWEIALLFWALLAIIGIIVWTIAIKQAKPHENVETTSMNIGGGVWKSSLAWQVSIFMGLQSFLFYVVISWLPAMLNDFGFSVAASGWLISYAQFISLPATFLAPVLAERFSNQKGIVLAIGGLYLIGFTGLFINGPLVLLVFWVTLIGIATGGSISLALAFLGMRSRNAQQASDLSGMAQSVGYILAALGPLIIGLLFDITNSWGIPIIVIIIFIILMTLFGLGASRDKYIFE